MAFPPGFMDEIKSRVSLAAVAGKKVTWDNRKSNPGKGDYWSPCPFHQEKTPSFHVDDRQGFYYCFGCHEKGDVVGFTMAIENLSFIEAIERLAAEAGMEMPDRDPRAKEKADARTQLSSVNDAAIQFFRRSLSTGAASAARAYLDQRGLNDAHRDRFEVGYAPDSYTALPEYLQNKNFTEQQIIDAGLAQKSDFGKGLYVPFRDRIMFPIRDPRGLAIGFGGRAMAADAKAKYVNSPQTQLFDKGRTLYNYAPAREASGKTNTLIVAEGYMDVIALATHGFDATVAPNGTAITPDQLRLMWRIADEPTIALDGDNAGLRAADKLIDLALPMLEPGKSLRFCILPEGLDPDDVLRKQGRAAMEALLADAQPLFEMLWLRETTQSPLDTPERRAAFDKRMRGLLREVQDHAVRGHYEAEIRNRRRALFSPERKQRGGPGDFKSWGKKKNERQPATQGTRTSALASAGDAAVDRRIREMTMLATCIAHPHLIASQEGALDSIEFSHPELGRLRDTLITLTADTEATTQADTENQPTKRDLPALINEKIGSAALEMILSSRHVSANPTVQPGSDPIKAEAALLDDIARHRALLGHQAEIRDASVEITGDTSDEGLTWRLKEAAEAREGSVNQSFEADEDGDGSRQRSLDFFDQLLRDSAKKSK